MNVKERLEQLKAVVSKLESRTKKIILAGVGGLIVFSIVIALLLNRNSGYEVLFSGLNAEEAQEIMGKLQESEIDYQYSENGVIRVPEKILDQTRASLAFEGYPKSGFGYQVYTENAGLMTTDTDKDRYALYDLQERIAATIRVIDGVQDAKVTIALGEQRKYVLTEDALNETTGHVMLTMENGASPSIEQAKAVQLLVASGVPGLEAENVVVVDSATGNEINTAEDEQSGLTSKDTDEIARMVEDQICEKVLHVLIPFYGEENIYVSAKAQINMQTLLRETITYTTPDKINQDDKTGIVSHDQGTIEISGTKDAVEGGVAGAETNADTPVYDTGAEEDGVEGYGARSWDKEFLVNQIKEQGQITPGALEDLTVSVAVNGDSYGSLTVGDLRSLVGNAAGIAEIDWNSKISVVSGPFYQDTFQPEEPEEEGGVFSQMVSSPLFYILLVVVLVLLVVAIVLLVLNSKRKKKKAAEEAAAAEGDAAAILEQMPSFDFNKEILDFQNDRGMELKQNIRDFTEENPEISAQLLKTWLNGGGGE
ncbi:MAG: flagellar M-ring protein FliF [Lachnospiraceae bacterium]|uniref:flagellar basal-body MS-ring/collar protein FliF n=1 Tax=Candidatus Merdisoma sp. JLR.KK011 TaxID=3114299 RepID=UPI0029D6ED39|nr:flagellar M-ring protein FliF [Lachnospiraceae bacterium]MCI9622809.1 flagellar M-ring protein FliF [Lachnospiraceae bacterium]